MSACCRWRTCDDADTSPDLGAEARRRRALGVASLAAAGERPGADLRRAAVARAAAHRRRPSADRAAAVPRLHASVPPAAGPLFLRLRPPGRFLPPLRRNVPLDRAGRPAVRPFAPAHPAAFAEDRRPPAAADPDRRRVTYDRRPAAAG